MTIGQSFARCDQIRVADERAPENDRIALLCCQSCLGAFLVEVAVLQGDALEQVSHFVPQRLLEHSAA